MQAAAIALEKQNQIQADNIGHKLLSKMGWKEGEGIGASKCVSEPGATSC